MDPDNSDSRQTSPKRPIASTAESSSNSNQPFIIPKSEPISEPDSPEVDTNRDPNPQHELTTSESVCPELEKDTDPKLERQLPTSESVCTELDAADIKSECESSTPDTSPDIPTPVESVFGFECPHCNLQIRKRANFLRHVKLHGKAPYKCRQCPRAFYRQNEFKEHVLVYHKGRRYACDHCNKEFKTRKARELHAASHQGVFKYMCRECGKGFQYTTNFDAHLNRHMGEKPYCCSKCVYRTASKSDLFKHRKHCKEGKGFECYECHKFYKTKETLRAHIKSHKDSFKDIDPGYIANLVGTGVVESSLGYLCPHCGLQIQKQGNYARHIRSHGEAQYQCAECSKGFHRKYEYEEHVAVVHKGQHYTCDLCNKEFKTKKAHKLHVDNHEGKYQFVCDQCGQGFQYIGNYKSHLNRHMGEKPYKCDKCVYRTGAKSDLARHRRTCKPGKKYECDICHKLLKTAKSLQYHRNAHTRSESSTGQESQPMLHQTVPTESPVKAFECDICHKFFKTKNSLRCHRKRHMTPEVQIQETTELALDPTIPTQFSESVLQYETTAASQQLFSISNGEPDLVTICFELTLPPESESTPVNPIEYQESLPEDDGEGDPGDPGDPNESTPEEQVAVAVDVAPVDPAKIYPCDQCDKRFKTTRHLKLHMDTHLGLYKFMCTLCGQGFQYKTNFDLHVSRHLGDKRYSCDRCNKYRAVARSDIAKHQEHCGKGKDHECPVCHKMYSSKQGIRVHMANAHPKHQTSISITEPKLDQASSSIIHDSDVTKSGTASQTSEPHLDKTSPKTGPDPIIEVTTACETLVSVSKGEPDTTTDDPEAIAASKSTADEETDPERSSSDVDKPAKSTSRERFKCPHCDKEVLKRANFERHLKLHGKADFICKDCSKGFHRKYEYEEHIAVVHKGQPYTCDRCKKTFLSRKALKMHVDNHQGKYKFVCSYCGHGFQDKRHFEAHVNRHLGLKPYKCDKCVYRTGAKPDLISHQRSCGQEKRFECDVCHNLYKTKKTLASHKTSHNNSQQFLCSSCGKSYPYISSLTNHKKRCGLQKKRAYKRLAITN